MPAPTDDSQRSSQQANHSDQSGQHGAKDQGQTDHSKLMDDSRPQHPQRQKTPTAVAEHVDAQSGKGAGGGHKQDAGEAYETDHEAYRAATGLDNVPDPRMAEHQARVAEMQAQRAEGVSR